MKDFFPLLEDSPGQKFNFELIRYKKIKDFTENLWPHKIFMAT